MNKAPDLKAHQPVNLTNHVNNVRYCLLFYILVTGQWRFALWSRNTSCFKTILYQAPAGYDPPPMKTSS